MAAANMPADATRMIATQKSQSPYPVTRPVSVRNPAYAK
jgi:hypothetical protein